MEAIENRQEPKYIIPMAPRKKIRTKDLMTFKLFRTLQQEGKTRSNHRQCYTVPRNQPAYHRMKNNSISDIQCEQRDMTSYLTEQERVCQRVDKDIHLAFVFINYSVTWYGQTQVHVAHHLCSQVGHIFGRSIAPWRDCVSGGRRCRA